MKNKLIKTVVAFLMLVPFRLTISVILIKLFTWTATVNGEEIPLKVVSASVITSKICYDLALGIYLCLILGKLYKNLDKLALKEIRENGKLASSDIYWHQPVTIISCLAIAVFIGTDIYLTHELFWFFNK